MAKYLKPDSEKGYIEDLIEIEELRFNNRRHAVLGFMLGDYDYNGKYVISSEICSELIKMKKTILESSENMELCLGQLKLDKRMVFNVNYEADKVTLSLLEKISYEGNHILNGGSYCNINEYVLDVIKTSGVINRNSIYQKWNISPYDVPALDIFDCDDESLAQFFNLSNRFKYLLEANACLLSKNKELEEIESEYVINMFELLKAYPILEKAVDIQFKSTLIEKQKFINAKKPNFAKTLMEILDREIDSNISKLSVEELERFKIDRNNLKRDANIKKADLIQTEKTTINSGDGTLSLSILDTEKFKCNSLHDSADAFVGALMGLSIGNTKKLDSLKEKYGRITTAVNENVKEFPNSSASSSVVSSAPSAKSADEKRADAKLSSATKAGGAKAGGAKSAGDKGKQNGGQKPVVKLTKTPETTKTRKGMISQKTQVKGIIVGVTRSNGYASDNNNTSSASTNKLLAKERIGVRKEETNVVDASFNW